MIEVVGVTGLFLKLFLCISFFQNVFGENTKAEITARINTFRRNDLLKLSISHYLSCNAIREIQIVWSDLSNQPPKNDLNENNNKVRYEVHDKDSLNNRFLAKLDIETNVILSIDDDVIVPCIDLEFALNVWSSNTRSLIGFSPRMTGFDPTTGVERYFRWQHTWWNGVYTIMLTKVSLMSTSYLQAFKTMVPSSVLEYIDKHRNCEDIAMAYVVLLLSQSPPVWVKGNLREIGSSGISSGLKHFEIRGECLLMIKNISLPPAELNRSDSNGMHKHDAYNKKWISGYQKSIKFGPWTGWDLGLRDYFKFYFDTK